MLRRFANNNGLAANQVSDYDIEVELVRTKFSNIAAMTFSLNQWGWVIGSDMENFAYSQDGYEWIYTHCPGYPGVLKSLSSVNSYYDQPPSHHHIIAVGDDGGYPCVKISTDRAKSWEQHYGIMYDPNINWGDWQNWSVGKAKWDEIQEKWYVSFSDFVYSISPDDPFTVNDSEPISISNAEGLPPTAITYHPEFGYMSAMPDGSIYKLQNIYSGDMAEEFSQPTWFALHDIEAIEHFYTDVGWKRRIAAVGGSGAIMEFSPGSDDCEFYWDPEYRTLRNITRLKLGYVATGDRGALLFRPHESKTTEWIPLKLSVRKNIVGIGENVFLEKVAIAFSDGTVGHIDDQIFSDLFNKHIK